MRDSIMSASAEVSVYVALGLVGLRRLKLAGKPVCRCR